MAANSIEKLVRQLVAQAKSEPQKAGILAVLLIVMIFVVARMGGGTSTPSQAVANISTIRGITLPDNFRIRNKTNSAVAALLEWSDRPIPAQLSRNLFVVNFEYFPQDGAKPAPVRIAQGDGFWDQLAKSMTLRADQRMERDVLIDRFRREAGLLKVQSTMMGASPKALINGQLMSEGEVVASFRVSKIEARRIVVEREGIKLEVRFNE